MKAGGFVIRSTIDLRLQVMADAALRDGLVAYDRRHGWRGPLANLRKGHDTNWIEGWRRKMQAVKMPAGRGDWQMAVVLDVESDGADIGLRDGGHGRIPIAELTWARKQGEVRVEPGKPAFRTATGPSIRKAGDVLNVGDVILVERLPAHGRNRGTAAETYALRQIPEVNGALVAMDPHTGRVLAMSGGFDFALSQYNTVTQAWRQPGSSFKPYVYLAALRAGYTPSSMLLDAPITFTNGRETYSPRNYSGQFYGPVTMRTALELSLNVSTLRLAQAIGLQKVAEMATQLGVSHKIEAVFAMPLGAYETTPLRHVTAYSMIVNGGKRVTPTLVDRIQDRYGRTIYRHDTRDCAACNNVAFRGQSMPTLSDSREQVIDADNAFQIVSILQGAAQRSPSVQALGRRFAGKTGTTNESIDAWFVGFSPDLAVAVWVGFDKPRSLGKTETGAIAAAPIFAAFMKKATTVIPAREFVPPKSLVAVQTAAGVEYYKRGTEPAVAPSPNIDTAAGPETVQVLRGGTDDQEVIAGALPRPGANSPPVYGFRSLDDAELSRDTRPKQPGPSRLDPSRPAFRSPDAPVIYR
jgi:penicillin-binding protein 1A